MKIGVHKLGFNDHKFEPSNLYNSTDANGMFTEVNLLMKAFQLHGYDVSYVDANSTKPYDIIIVFNGHENYTSNLKKLKSLCKELNYLLTDTAFYHGSDHKEVDNYFVQSPVKLYDKPTFNSQLHKLPIFERQFYSQGLINVNENNMLIFGGSVKSREKEVLEYIIRPNTKYLLKFEELGLSTRVPILEYKKMLRTYAYGIVIINPKDVLIGNITWRYYEYIANGVLTFVDYNSDPNELILNHDDFMKVRSYKELITKQRLLKENPEFKKSILRSQHHKLRLADVNGRTFIDSLLANREENK